jgi:hypothetical protein
MVSANIACGASLFGALINLIFMSLITNSVRKASSSIYTGKVKGLVAGSLLFIILSFISLAGGLGMSMKNSGNYTDKILIANAVIGASTLMMVFALLDTFRMNDNCRVCKGDALDKDIDTVYNSKLKGMFAGYFIFQILFIIMCSYFSTNIDKQESTKKT